MSRILRAAPLALCALVAALPAVASATSGPSGPSTPQSVAADAQAQAGAQQELLARQQAANTALTPPAIEARRDSAQAYQDLSRSEAIDVAQDTAPTVLTQPGFAPIATQPGDQVTLTDINTARITNPDGSTDTVVSTLPLGFVDHSGDLVRADLDLHAGDDGFTPDSSPVPTAIPDRLDDPLTVGPAGDRLRIVPDGAAAVSGVRQDTGVFYANADTDTDFFVKPVLGGLETYDILRSADSPETLTYAVTDDEGATGTTVTADGAQGGAVVLGAGGSLGHVSQAQAFDADHRPVPVTTTFDGDRITLHVEHRGADYAYPITVDPTFITDKNAACWNYVANHNGCQIDLWETEYNTDYGNGLGAGWTYNENAWGNQTDPHNLISGFFSTNTVYLGMGLTIQERGYNHFDAGEGGNWYLTAPGEVQIYAAGFLNVSTDNWDNNSCAFTAIRNADGSFGTAPQYVGGCAQQTLDAGYLACTGTNCQPGGSATYGNMAWFGSLAFTNSAPWGWTNAFTHDMGSVEIYMHDYVAPRWNVADPGGSQAVQVTLGDFGLGMKRWAIYAWGVQQDGWDDNTQPSGVPRCSGGVSRFVCPHDVVRWVSRCNLRPGTNLLSVEATDVSGNSIVNGNFGVYVDPSLTGFDVGGDFTNFTNGQTLEDRPYALHVGARAPCGVNDISVRLDDQDLPYAIGVTARDDIINVQDLAPGTHTLRIDARGRKDNGSPADSWMGARVITFVKADEDDQHLIIDDDEDDLPEHAYAARTPAQGPPAAYVGKFGRQAGTDLNTSINEQPTGHLPLRSGGTSAATVPLTTAGHRWLGMSAQRPEMTTDPRFAGLSVPYRRLIVPYDAIIRASPTAADPNNPMGAQCNPATSNAAGPHTIAESNYEIQWIAGAGIDPLLKQSMINKLVNGDPVTHFEGYCDQVHLIDQWMAANNGFTNDKVVNGETVEPLISFSHSRSPGYWGLQAPSQAYYLQAVRAFRQRYPNVKLFTAWNEPNNNDQPYRLNPQGAADRLADMRNVCDTPDPGLASCFVLAGDFADSAKYDKSGKPTIQTFDNYLTNYMGEYRSVAGRDWNGPWAMHLHSSAQDRFCPAGSPSTCHNLPNGSAQKLSALLSATTVQSGSPGWPGASGPPVWITEVGAITSFPGSNFSNPVARVEKSYLNAVALAARSSRITRMYYYALWGDAAWDSGLLDTTPDHNERQIYDWYAWMANGGNQAPAISARPPATTNGTTATFSFVSQSSGTQFECRVDAGTWAPCTSPVSYTSLAAGPHTFDVQSVSDFPAATAESDFAGRGTIGSGQTLGGEPSNPAASSAWSVDLAPPDTSIVSGPSGPTSSTSASFGLGGTDDVGVTAYECQLDGGAWATCATPKVYTGLAAGAHTFRARSKDAFGNVDATPATATWSVDVLAPDTTLGTPPSSPTASTSATLTFSGTDSVGVTGYECSLDAGAWAACTSPKAYTSLAGGSHTFRVRATDAAGNADATPATATWTVDVAAPETTISSGPSPSTASTSASFAFAGTDNVAVASYQCRLDAGTWAACTSPKAYSALSAGSHTFAVRATDTVGNVDATPASATWLVDTTAPNTTIGSAPSGSTTATTASIVFSGTDNDTVASYECQLDAGAWGACVSPKAYSALAVGAHTVNVRATDAAGNVDATPASATWTVTAPATTLLGNQAIETFLDGNSANDVEAFPFVATGGGSAASVSVYLGSGSAGAISVGLYTSSGGRPARLLASGSLSSPTASAWNTVPLSGRPVIASGTTYHLALQSATGGIKFRTRSGGPCTSRSVSPGTTTMPQGWPATDGATWDTCPVSMYVNAGTADTTAPDTTISAQPGASTTATTASFSFGGTDDYAVASYECRLDAGAWTACASPRGYAGLAVGAHTFAVRALDAAGNADGSPATASWTVTAGGGAPSLLAGNATVETHAEPIDVGTGRAWPVTATAAGTAGAVSVYVDAGSTAGELQVALYANSASAPSTRLASGSIAAPAAGAWNVVPLSGATAIVSGTAYWLGVMSTSPTLSVRDRSGGTCTARTLNTPLGAFPGTWAGAIGTSTSCPPSITLTTG